MLPSPAMEEEEVALLDSNKNRLHKVYQALSNGEHSVSINDFNKFCKNVQIFPVIPFLIHILKGLD